MCEITKHGFKRKQCSLPTVQEQGRRMSSNTVIDTKHLHVYVTKEGMAVCSACPKHKLSQIAELDLTSITLETPAQVVEHLRNHVLMNHDVPSEALQEEFWIQKFRQPEGMTL